MLCANHQVDMTWRNGGVSKKTGKPYNGFWSCPSRESDGGYCKFKPPIDNSSKGQFVQDLDRSSSIMDQSKKNEEIIRQTVVKALIGAGYKWSLETCKELEAWVAYCKTGKTILSQSFIPPTIPKDATREEPPIPTTFIPPVIPDNSSGFEEPLDTSNPF